MVAKYLLAAASEPARAKNHPNYLGCVGNLHLAFSFLRVPSPRYVTTGLDMEFKK